MDKTFKQFLVDVEEGVIGGKQVGNVPHVRKVRVYATKNRGGMGGPHWVLSPYYVPSIYRNSKKRKKRKSIKEMALEIFEVINFLEEQNDGDQGK